jgi:hypothetical protein
MWSQLGSDRRVLSPSPLDKVIEKYEGRAEFLFVYGPEVAPETELPTTLGEDNFRNLVPEFRDLPLLVQTLGWAARAKRAALFARKTKTLRRMLVVEDGATSVSRLYGVGHLLTVVVDVWGRVALRRVNIPPENLDESLQLLLAGK